MKTSRPVTACLFLMGFLVLPTSSQMPNRLRTPGGRRGPAYPNELMAELFSPGGFNAGLRTATEVPPSGPPAVCWTSGCLKYTLIHKGPTYERRRYETMPVVVAEDSTGWMSPMVNYFKLKLYFEEAQNVQNITMPLTFPVITVVKASRSHMMMMPLPPANRAAPPTPYLRSVRIEYLPAMEVLVKPYQSVAFGAGNENAVNQFRTAVGGLASGAAFVADYVPATEFYNRRSEIWLIASYPNRRSRPSALPGK